MSGHENGVSLSDMAAAPTTLVVRGVELQINVVPLTDWARLERWFRREMMSDALVAVEAVPIISRGPIVIEIMRAAAMVSIADQSMLNGMITSVGGMLRLATMSLARGGNDHIIAEPQGRRRRRRSRGVAEADVVAFIEQDIESLADIISKVAAISLAVDEPDDDEDQKEIPPDPPADEGEGKGEDQGDAAAPTA